MMSKIKSDLSEIELFASLSPEERGAIAMLAVPRQFNEGEIIYEEDDAGTSMFVLLEGVVELQTRLNDGPVHSLITMQAGAAFGFVDVIDPQARGIIAKALEPSNALEITREAFEEYLKKHPESGVNIVLALAVGLARQLRIAVDLFRQNLSWTLDVSGAAALNLSQLSADSTELELTLVNGKQLEGTLLKVESGATGHQLLIRDAGHRVHLVPYHALVSLSFRPPPGDPAHNDNGALSLEV